MLMPKKHINLSESLIGIGGIILKCIGNGSKTLDTIISYTDQIIDTGKSRRIYNNMDSFFLAIDFLYSIGAIDINEEGGIYNVFSRTKCE